jgi:long-chain fatty acid transport protein
MKSWLYIVFVLSVVWLVTPPTANASPLLEMMGGFGDGGGQQARNLATGASAAYFNPALLVDAPTGMTAGVAVLGARIGVQLQGRGDGRFDVPLGVENAAHADGSRFDNYPIATETLQIGREETPSQSPTTARPRQAAGTGDQTLSYGAIGINAHFFDDKLAIGFFGLIPLADFMTLRSFYADEREQYTSNSLHPEMYGDRLTSLAFGVGGGYRIHKRFSLGAGCAFNVKAGADARAYVADASQLDSLLLNIDVKIHAGISPHFGFAWTPVDRFRITGTVHTPQQLLIDTDVQFLLATGLEQTSHLKLLNDWMPWQAGLGTSIDVVQTKHTIFTLAGSVLFGRWSQYKDRHAEAATGWNDTWTGALGTRLNTNRWSFGFDGQYKPTPVPLQRGRTNYVDNNRIGASANLDYTIPIGDTKLKFGAQLQGFLLLERFQLKTPTPTSPDGVNRNPSLVKDEVPDDARLGAQPFAGATGLQTNNPGFPGYASKGSIMSGGLYVALTL